MTNPSSCTKCHSFQTSGFSLLSETNKARLGNVKQSHHYRKNEVIFSQGTPIDSVHCISTGLIKLESVGEDGHSITVGFMKSGDLLGLGGVLSSAPSTFFATAIEDTFTCSFSKDFFKQLLQDSPALSIDYMTRMFKELRETRQRLLSGVDKDVSARVAEALVYLKANYSEHMFTRREIADWAGTTTESVIRTLSQFEDEGIIEQQGRRINVTDPNRLSMTAGALI